MKSVYLSNLSDSQTHLAGRFMPRPLLTAIIFVALFALNGCLITSPYWNQQLQDHTKAVPIQTWITSASKDVKIECSKAFHGGLYPAPGSETWLNVTTITSQSKALFDPLGGKIFGAGKSMVLPAGCWRKDPANNIWYSALRAYRVDTPNSKFNVVDKAGLECVGRENGKAASWFAWLSKGCAKTYSNSSTKIPYVIFYAPQ